MVTGACASEGSRQGAVMLELVVAIGILLIVMLPLAYSFTEEQRLARSYYYRAIAMQIVDGEAEILAAGGWRAFPKGQHSYAVSGRAATNLPPGRFTLAINDEEARLEWRPAGLRQGGTVFRVIPLLSSGGGRP
jgi:hypothetical protein